MAVLLFVSTLPAFTYLNQHLEARYDFLLNVDQTLPLLPWTLVVYSSYFFLIPVAAVRVAPHRFARFCIGLLAAFTLCCVGFWLWPAHYPRPNASALTGPLGQALLWVYSVDAPGNTLPSVHVALAWYCGGFVWRQTGNRKWLVWALLISVSTLTTKQHFVVDVLGGLLVAAVVLLTLEASELERLHSFAQRKAVSGDPASGWNIALCLGTGLAIWGLQAIAARQQSVGMLLVLGLLMAWVQVPNYSLMHEAFHRVLHPNPRIGYVLGFVQTLHFPGPFSFMQACHLGHHRRNRTDAEMFDSYYRGQSVARKRAQFYSLYLGLFWFLPVLSTLILAVHPKLLRHQVVRDAPAARAMVDGLPARYLWKIRLEAWCVILCHAALFVLLELRWSSYLLLYACHGLWWSAHNYLAHAHAPRSVKNGAFNIRLPQWLSTLLLNFNYHLTHHQHPRVPWHQLPEMTNSDRPAIAYFAAVRRFWKGPVETREASPRESPPTDPDVDSKCSTKPQRSVPERPRLRARTLRRAQLTAAQRESMWQLFSHYYDNVDARSFATDLDEKSHVVLLEDLSTGCLGGFSTIVLEPEQVRGRRAQVLFSGDTIVARRYWGDKALHKQFVYFLIRCKLSKPFTPLYWLLISKGYKTYLLLARNFPIYYPRVDQQTPSDYSRLIDRVCQRRFGDAWRPSEGVVRFSQCHGRLRHGVAPIRTAHLKQPDIEFFMTQNPGHAEGNELACVGVVTSSLFLRFLWRTVLRQRPRQPQAPQNVTGAREITG